MNDRDHAEDILQDIFVRVHRQIKNVKDPGRILSWIYQVTRNAIIDHYRNPQGRQEHPAGLSTELEVLNEGPTILQRTPHGDAAQLREELAGCLRPMIERLSREYREAITLVELKGLTQQAAAKQTGISLSGMKSRVQRGRKQLTRMLYDCCLIERDRRSGVLGYRAQAAPCDACTDGD